MVCNTITHENAFENSALINKLKLKSCKKGWVLNDKQMEFLQHKPYMYNCFVSSIMELLFLQKFWFYLSRYVPSNIAPCTITITGLLINVICCSSLLYYSSDAKQTTPNGIYLVCAIGLFLYQIFDALDGKQAVKVQDTPIEEVYDHGCDAVSALFVTQSVAIATRLGFYPVMQFTFFLIPLIAFYFTHYSCHVTHVMVFGRMDVIEGQWAMICVHILTSIFGQDLWKTELIANITITHILFILTVIALMSSIVNNIFLILGFDSPMDKYIKIPRKTDRTKWNPLISVFIITVLAINSFRTGIFEQNTMLFIFAFGLAFAKLSYKLQVSNVTHENMPKIDSCIIGPIFLTINHYFPITDERTALFITLCYALLDQCIYFILSSLDMKEALDLNIFSLKYDKYHQKCRNKNYGYNFNGTENEQAIKNIQNSDNVLFDYYNSIRI